MVELSKEAIRSLHAGERDMKLRIIGSGPCGLGAGHRLWEAGHADWKIFEGKEHVGGLSASFRDGNGFTWDIGGHVLFSHYDYFSEAVNDALDGRYYEHLRESWIRTLGCWVPYPFQNNIRHLPAHALRECLDGLTTTRPEGEHAPHFRKWMDAVFGSGIVKYFMGPYNKKVWAVPLETMSAGWISERVSIVDRTRIEKNISTGTDDVSWGPNNTFKFPKQGGTGAIFQGIARSFPDHLAFEHALVSVDLENREVLFQNGSRARYDVLLSTIPLDQFVQKCISVSDAVYDAAGQLVHTGGLIVGLGFAGQRSDSKCWMYFPEDNCPFYRVTNFHNYSPFNVPNGAVDRYFSLMCETSYSEHKPVDKKTIVEETIAGLIASGMITEAESRNIVSRYLIDIPYSYPVPTLGRDAALATIQPYLESYGVYSRGRFGAWKYEVGNMDHSFMQGVEVIDRVLSGKMELTVNGRA
jgi:protoporphyrinogen oxidase